MCSCYGVFILLERVLRGACHEVFGIVAFFRGGEGYAENDATQYARTLGTNDLFFVVDASD